MNLAFKIFLWLAALPNRRFAFRLARLISLALLPTESAKITSINVAVCFPDATPAEQKVLVRDSLHHMAMLFFELAQLRYWPLEKLLADIEVLGTDVLDQAFDQKQGVLLLVPHLGNWELMCVFLGHHYTVAALYDPPKVGGIEDEIKHARERFQGKMFPIGVGGMRSVLRELRSGGLVAILPDQVPELEGGVYAPFFGQPALTMTLPHQLKSKTKARTLLGCVSRRVGSDGFMGYRLEFSSLDGEQPDQTDSVATCNAINSSIENSVRAVPAQYQWEYKRFKRPPTGGKTNIYRRQ